MKRYRIGVVGLGHRGREIIKLSAVFPNTELVAACDIRPENWYKTQWLSAAPMAEMFPKATFYLDYDKMLTEANLDVIIVETGADIHCDFCCKALEKNINVFAEIPLVASLQEAEKIWKTAEASSAIISVGANANYQRFAEQLVEFYKKGLLGKPYCMEAEYIHASFNAEYHKHLNENGDWRKLLSPIRYCTHSLGPLQRIMNQELRFVSCFGTGSHIPVNPGEYKKDDMQSAQFQTEDGTVIRLMRNGRCKAWIGDHNYRVFGTEGYMERIDRMRKPVIRYNSMKELDIELKEIEGTLTPKSCEDTPEAQMGHGGLDYVMMDCFLKALDEKKPAISVKEGLAMTIPGIYAEESAKQKGKVLKIKYPWDSDWNHDFEPAD